MPHTDRELPQQDIPNLDLSSGAWIEPQAEQQLKSSSTVAIDFIDRTIERVLNLLDLPAVILALNGELGYQPIALRTERQLSLEDLDLAPVHQAILGHESQFLLIDCHKHETWSNSQLHREQGVVTCAGIAIVDRAGNKIGTMIGLDWRSRKFNRHQIDTFKLIAELVATEFERQILTRSQVSSWAARLEGKSFRDPDDRSAWPDLTNQRRELEYLRSQAIVDLSHYLRAPLTSILGMTRVLQQEIYGTLNVKQKAYLDIVYHGGQELINYVDEVERIRSLDPQDCTPIVSPIDLNMFCQSILQKLQPIADIQQQQLTLSIDLPRYHILLDREKAGHILYYPILHTLQTASPKQTISIEIGQLNGQLQIQVYSRTAKIGQIDRYLTDDRASTSNIDIRIALSQALAKIHQGHLMPHNMGYGYQILLPLIYAQN
jgi:signal transduction histidine kinase